ncbi:MAG: DinB family protein [Proteobacteria bacterium]|nr:DinB family protein [Pseudomonadota bacterium]
MSSSMLDALAAFPQQLAVYYSEFPASHVHWTPADWTGIPSERFTAIEQLWHVHDVEIDGYHQRFRRILEEEHPFLPDLGSEALAQARAYANKDAAEALAGFRVARERTVAMLAELDATQLARTAVFEDYGPTTTRGLVHYLCSHDQQHLAGLQWLLGKIDATRSGIA